MNTTQPNNTGQARVQRVGDGVVEMSFTGYMTRAAFVAALAELSALCDEHPKIYGLLWSTGSLDGYEPGNTALALKWVAQYTQIRRTAVVTRSQAVASLVHLGRVMIPGLEIRSFRDEDEAMEWFETPLTGRARTRSARFKAA